MPAPLGKQLHEYMEPLGKFDPIIGANGKMPFDIDYDLCLPPKMPVVK